MNFPLLFIISIISLCIAEKRSYKGYNVYKVTPKNIGHAEFLSNVIQRNGIGEFWDDPVHVNYETRVMVSGENRNQFIKIMSKTNMQVEEVIKDLQRVIDDQLRPAEISAATSETFLGMHWNQYYNLDEINTWLDEIVKNYPDIVEPIVMGRSNENREIKGIIIRYRPRTNSTLIGVLQGTLHAREWITPATITWIVKEFLTSRNRDVRALAENFEWHIFPVVNPDGYVYTFTTHRMWRKNRNPRNFTTCVGVSDDMSNGIDLNRNFDHVWNSVGASQDPCSNLFAGPAAFSEPESTAISNYILNLNTRGRMIYYLDFHSFTQLLVVPFSHVSGRDVLVADNYADMYEIAVRSADKITERFGKVYRVGVAADILYYMSGTAFDWVKNVTNIPISYLIELRDMGQYGFLLPAEQIIPNNLEFMDGFLEMDRTARTLGYYAFSGTKTLVCSFVLMIVGLFISFIY